MNEIKTAGEFGLLKGGQQIAALLALITDIHSLGLPVARACTDDLVLLGHGRQDPQ
jgi:hypothetical protein